MDSQNELTEQCNSILKENSELKKSIYELKDENQLLKGKLSEANPVDYKNICEKIKEENCALINENYDLKVKLEESLNSSRSVRETSIVISENESTEIRQLKAKLNYLSKGQEEFLKLKEDFNSLMDTCSRLERFKNENLQKDFIISNLEEQIKNNSDQNKDKLEIVRLSDENRTLLAKNGELRLDVDKLFNENSIMENKIIENEKIIEQLNSKHDILTERINSHENKEKIFLSQVQCYRRLSEDIMNIQSGNSQIVKDESRKILDFFQEFDSKISNYISLANEFERKISRIASSVSSVENTSLNDSKISKNDKRKDELIEEVAKLKDELYNLSEENKKLNEIIESKQMESNPHEESCLILQMNSNPTDNVKKEKEKELNDLRIEVGALRHRVAIQNQRIEDLMNCQKRRRSASGQDEDDCDFASKKTHFEMNLENFEKVEDPLEKIKTLENKVKSLMNREKRYMETFEQCSNILHQAIGLIFGCRIDLRAPGVYRITLLDKATMEMIPTKRLTFRFELKKKGYPWTIDESVSPIIREMNPDVIESSIAVNSVQYLIGQLLVDEYGPAQSNKHTKMSEETMQL